jgi:hypothetical protein
LAVLLNVLLEGWVAKVFDEVVAGLFLSKAGLLSDPIILDVAGFAVVGVVFAVTVFGCYCFGVVVFDYAVALTGAFFSTLGVVKIELFVVYTLFYVGAFVGAVIVFGFV